MPIVLIQSRTYSFMGRGVVERPLKELGEFYKDIQSTFLWDHLLVVSVYYITRILHRHHFPFHFQNVCIQRNAGCSIREAAVML